MNSLNELEGYLNQNTVLDINEMRQLRKNLHKSLKVLDEKIDSIINKTQATNRCPRCNSIYTKRHGKTSGKTPKIRYMCLDCDSTFVESRSLLHYRRRYPDKIVDMIVSIHTTDKSVSQIQDDLDISPQTYYKWKKVILEIFPQLEQEFAWQGKKRGKL
ncbi:IS1/IS1595 family N-terminal zinc-binding domain-containing protein [Ruminiclostridium cellobioparum]|uniref:IS1/IS1595 family N-terminal zinc-binding domain-containing protein n=1 Tax=Ruminiclostridium cellobioparum TaxID=29355 RepID=UPI0028AB126F|nr:hypothetical protein [Ruminiclostridium cellobioparum]